MTEEKPKSKKINDLEALSTLTKSANYAIPILDLNDRDADGDPKLKQVPINLLQSLFQDETNLHKVATTGKYSDLKNLPLLFSGNYADLQGKPDLSQFLTEHQDISGKADKSELFSGNYDDLSNKPTWPIIVPYYRIFPVLTKTPGQRVEWILDDFATSCRQLYSGSSRQYSFWGRFSSDFGTYFSLGELSFIGFNTFFGQHSRVAKTITLGPVSGHSVLYFPDYDEVWLENDSSSGELTIEGFFLV